MATQDEQNKIDEEVWDLAKHEVPTIDGGRFTCPKVSWRKERAIIKLISEVVQPLIEAGIFSGTDPTTGAQTGQLAQALQLLLTVAPDKLTEATALLTGKDADWVMDNLVVETITGLVVPFLASKQAAILAALRPHLGAVTQPKG